jgi:hypothetical protein
MTLVRSHTGIVRSVPTAKRHKPRAARRDIEGPVQSDIIFAIESCVRPVDVRAVPNATGKLGKAQQGKLKREGRKAGTLDLIVAWPGGAGFIEVKPPGYSPSDVSPEQAELISRWRFWGLNVGIATCGVTALKLLASWGAPLRVQL